MLKEHAMLLMSEVKLLSQVQSIVPFHSVEHSAAFLHHMEDMTMTTRSEGGRGCKPPGAEGAAECNVMMILPPPELWWTRLPDSALVDEIEALNVLPAVAALDVPLNF